MPIGSSPFESEQIGWLGTTGRDGYPHAVPIWFLWRDERAIILSEPTRPKCAISAPMAGWCCTSGREMTTSS